MQNVYYTRKEISKMVESAMRKKFILSMCVVFAAIGCQGVTEDVDPSDVASDLGARLVSDSKISAQDLLDSPVLLDPDVEVFNFDFGDGAFDWTRVYFFHSSGRVITMQENCEGVYASLLANHGVQAAEFFRQIMEGEAARIAQFRPHFAELEDLMGGFVKQGALCCCSDGFCVEVPEGGIYTAE